MDTITFQGIVYNRSDLSAELISMIETYNSSGQNVSGKTPNMTDYGFRLNQALQIFGDAKVILAIQLLIQLETGNNNP